MTVPPSTAIDLAKVIDGNGDGHSGWAVASRLGVRHEAVFELKGGVEIGEGAALKIARFGNKRCLVEQHTGHGFGCYVSP